MRAKGGIGVSGWWQKPEGDMVSSRQSSVAEVGTLATHISKSVEGWTNLEHKRRVRLNTTPVPEGGCVNP
ncbi:hypothetical protein K435DRAFT_338921 [Dendrothele bispora CBS 962.96]|uniref:Uncharacterized protein n=1 Tax=Dendrothele bispora (strain CBS 962.96) TaxID=1314807 RepID=A0A4S8MK90_DENBC|nr:hypothetical protein K435DRAFT_338921 [Dendrothele bispora CBS 962.96]